MLVHESLKPSHQCAKAAAKANAVLGQMSKAFHYRDKLVWLQLYKTFVRPHLEFAIQAWSPWLKGGYSGLAHAFAIHKISALLHS